MATKLIKKIYSGQPQNALKAASVVFDTVGYATVMKAFRKKDVKLNGVRCEQKTMVDNGDELSIYISEDAIRRPDEVYRDDNILIVNKPQGLASVGEASAEVVLSEAYGRPVFAVHRLDTNTAGLMMFALTRKAEKRLLMAFKGHEVEKKYYAKVFGSPKKSEGIFEDWFVKQPAEGRVKVLAKPTEGALTAVTQYKTMTSNGITTLLDVLLHTGRTHQIRAAMAAHGLPVVGDGKYGDYAKNKQLNCQRQCLVAYSIRLKISESDPILGYLAGRVFELPLAECRKALGEF